MQMFECDCILPFSYLIKLGIQVIIELQQQYYWHNLVSPRLIGFGYSLVQNLLIFETNSALHLTTLLTMINFFDGLLITTKMNLVH